MVTESMITNARVLDEAALAVHLAVAGPLHAEAEIGVLQTGVVGVGAAKHGRPIPVEDQPGLVRRPARRAGQNIDAPRNRVRVLRHGRGDVRFAQREHLRGRVDDVGQIWRSHDHPTPA